MEQASIDYLCIYCVGDPWLKSEIQESGSRQVCFYCKKKGQSIDLDYLADRVDEVYRKYYRPSETPVFDREEGDKLLWKLAGSYPEDIVSEMMEVDIEIANKIVEVLSDRFQHEVHDGGDDYYDSGATYEETPIDTYEYSQTWKDFCLQIKHKSRFFDPENIDNLTFLFEDIENHKTGDGVSAVRILDLNDYAFRYVYRAREANDEQSILKICSSPSKELGPPPIEKAKASRMNPAGIPVFYASFDPDTCVAEIRLPVGGIAIVGKFELIRSIRVLDLTVFDDTSESISMFHPDFDKTIIKREFLKDFHNEISKPVLPKDEPIDYIPTQAVAEYLSNMFEPTLDGVIFSSVQTNGNGKNIVLFNPTSMIEDSTKDENQSKAEPRKRGYFWEDSFVVSDLEDVVQPREDEEPLIFLDGRMEDQKQPFKQSSNQEPILRLVPDSIELRKVTAVKYDTQRISLIQYTIEDANRRLFQSQNRPKL